MRVHGEVKMCSKSHCHEETHSWEEDCLSEVGSGSISYFCRRVEKYVFDYKRQKKKRVSGKLTFTAGMCPESAEQAGQEGWWAFRTPPLSIPFGNGKKEFLTPGQILTLWVVSSTAVRNLNMLVSFMSCLWWNTTQKYSDLKKLSSFEL